MTMYVLWLAINLSLNTENNIPITNSSIQCPLLEINMQTFNSSNSLPADYCEGCQPRTPLQQTHSAYQRMNKSLPSTNSLCYLSQLTHRCIAALCISLNITKLLTRRSCIKKNFRVKGPLTMKVVWRRGTWICLTALQWKKQGVLDSREILKLDVVVPLLVQLPVY